MVNRLASDREFFGATGVQVALPEAEAGESGSSFGGITDFFGDVGDFFTEDIPDFFTDDIPDFFTDTVPEFLQDTGGILQDSATVALAGGSVLANRIFHEDSFGEAIDLTQEQFSNPGETITRASENVVDAGEIVVENVVAPVSNWILIVLILVAFVVFQGRKAVSG